MKKLVLTSLAMAAVAGSFSAQATLTSIRNCEVTPAAIQITSIQKQSADSPPVLLPAGAGVPSDCLGVYNDKTVYPSGVYSFGSGANSNLGWKDTSFLNDTSLFGPYGAFVDQSDLQDLKDEGVFVDPGWIFVGKLDLDTGAYESGTVKRDGFDSYTFEEGIIDISGGTSGTWTYTPPKYNPQTLMNILGANKFFDQAAVIFKGGNDYAIYNFSLKDLLLDPVVGTDDENYMFSGTWDMSKVLKTPNGKNPAGLSHVSLWLRDPSFVTQVQVPEPATVAILGLGLLGLRLRRKH